MRVVPLRFPLVTLCLTSVTLRFPVVPLRFPLVGLLPLFAKGPQFVRQMVDLLGHGFLCLLPSLLIALQRHEKIGSLLLQRCLKS